MVPPASHRVSRVPWYSGSCSRSSGFVYWTFTVSGLLSQNSSTTIASIAVCSPQPRRTRSFGLASFPFARRYLGNRCFFLFLLLLRCFSSEGFLHIPMYSVYDAGFLARRVSPFGYLRVNGYLLLTAAFRSLSRPSSAPDAKSSSLRSY